MEQEPRTSDGKNICAKMIAVKLMTHVTPKTGTKPPFTNLKIPSFVLAPSTAVLIAMGAMASIPSLVDSPVYPAKTLYIASTKVWPRGAKTRNLKEAILKAFAFTFDAARCSNGLSDGWT